MLKVLELLLTSILTILFSDSPTFLIIREKELVSFALIRSSLGSDLAEERRTLPRQSKQICESSTFDSASSNEFKTISLNFQWRSVTKFRGTSVLFPPCGIVLDKSSKGSEILTDFKCLKAANAPSSLRPHINWKTFCSSKHSSNFTPISPRFPPSGIHL